MGKKTSQRGSKGSSGGMVVGGPIASGGSVAGGGSGGRRVVRSASSAVGSSSSISGGVVAPAPPPGAPPVRSHVFFNSSIVAATSGTGGGKQQQSGSTGVGGGPGRRSLGSVPTWPPEDDRNSDSGVSCYSAGDDPSGMHQQQGGVTQAGGNQASPPAGGNKAYNQSGNPGYNQLAYTQPRGQIPQKGQPPVTFTGPSRRHTESDVVKGTFELSFYFEDDADAGNEVAAGGEEKQEMQEKQEIQEKKEMQEEQANAQEKPPQLKALPCECTDVFMCRPCEEVKKVRRSIPGPSGKALCEKLKPDAACMKYNWSEAVSFVAKSWLSVKDDPDVVYYKG